MEAQLPDRIYTKDPLPDLKELKTFISSKKAIKLFESLLKFLDDNYNFEQEIVFGGKNYGVMVRYRKNGKTLVSIFPEKDAIAIVLVYGKKEVITFEANRTVFDSYMTEIFDNTHQYHDGRWMLIRLNDNTLLPDLEKMIMIKKSVKKQ